MSAGARLPATTTTPLKQAWTSLSGVRIPDAGRLRVLRVAKAAGSKGWASTPSPLRIAHLLPRERQRVRGAQREAQ